MIKKICAVICVGLLIICTPVVADDEQNPLFSLSVLLMQQSIRTQQQYVRTQQQYVRTQYQKIRTQQQWIHMAKRWVTLTDADTTHILASIGRSENNLQNIQEWIDFQVDDIHKIKDMILENQDSLRSIKLGLVAVSHDTINVLVTEIATFEKRIRTQELSISNEEKSIQQTEQNIKALIQKINHVIG